MEIGTKIFNKKTDGFLNFSDLKSTYAKVIYSIIFIILLLAAAVCVLPVLWAAFSAFKEPAEMYKIPPTFLPESFSISRVTQVLSSINFGSYFMSTLCIIIGCWIIDVTFNGFAGYVLSKIKPRGTPILETLIFWSMMLPGVSLTPLYMTFVDMPLLHVDLSGTYLPLWAMAGCNAFNVMLLRNFFNGIPQAYMEAAKIDGCSNSGIFFRIILPLSKPVIAVISIYSILNSWNSFMWPYLILGGSNREPISVLLYQISGGGLGLKENDILMVALLASVPPILIYALLSKHISGGLNMSGIKG